MPVDVRLAALIPVLLLMTACPRPPLDFGKDGEAKSPEELLKRVALTETTVVGVKGEGKLTVDSPQGKGSVTLFTGVLHPAFLHLEQLDFFGRPQGVLTTDGQEFGLYDAQAGKYFRGPATPINLGRFLPVVLPPAELAGLLLGRVPRIPAQTMELSVDAKAGVYVLVLHQGAATQTLHIAPPSHRVVKSTVTGLSAYDVELGDVTAFGGVWFPRHLTLTVPQARTRVELAWKELTLNDSADLTLYERSPPDNVPVVEVDGEGRPKP
jgi:hypothetical protein